MPHFQIDYSHNLENTVDMNGLCEAIRKEAASIETFPTAGIRVRAVAVNHYAIADGDPKHGFIDISIRIREGRPKDVQEQAVIQIFETAKTYLSEAMKTHSIALSTELREINADLSPKCGTIRDHLKDTR